MRIFLEIFKEQTVEEMESGIPREEIRLDVSDLSEEQIISKKDEIVSSFGWSKYKAQIHYCYHDESPTMPCEIREI